MRPERTIGSQALVSAARFLQSVAVVFLGLGAGAASAENVGEDPGPEKSCLRVRDTRGFTAIDDRHVYVKSVRGGHYLLTMANTCFGLESSVAITIANRFDRVCSNDGAWLTYQDFNQKKRCVILTVESVRNLEHAEKIVAERRPTPTADAGGT